jgi:hypothetical protein
MSREWNPMWNGALDDTDPVSRYNDQLKRMVVASIDWVEDHPTAILAWKERDIRSIMQQVGIPDDISPEQVQIIAPWDFHLRADNQATDEWFRFIIERGLNGGPKEEEPTVRMMQKAMAFGMLVMKEGWDAMNTWVSTMGADTSLVN